MNKLRAMMKFDGVRILVENVGADESKEIIGAITMMLATRPESGFRNVDVKYSLMDDPAPTWDFGLKPICQS